MKQFLFLLLPVFLATAWSAIESPIVPGLNAFTTAAYQQVRHGDANLILSPFNLATALSMAWSGARGATAAEFAKVLHQQRDASYDSALAALVAALSKAGNTGANELHAANGLWVQNVLSIQPAFEKALAHDYHAPLVPLGFAVNSESARERINQWTAQHTKDKIQNLFPPGSIHSRTRLVLTSAIYFYGKWQFPFLTTRTEPADFTLISGATTRASFMNQTERFGYADTGSSQILEMPYAGTGMAFYVLLPKTPGGLADLEKSITPDNLTAWFGNLASKKVQVALPKFRVESQFSLRKELSAMGMPSAFSDHADFSGIDGSGQLAISEVMHKAFVDVSEQGTEAAAATGITIRPMSMPAREEPLIFRADHPFLFLIRDTHSGAILFIGRLTRPT